MRRGLVVLVTLATALAGAQSSRADNGIRIGPYSGQVDTTRAVIGARVTARGERAGRRDFGDLAVSGRAAGAVVSIAARPTNAAGPARPTYPTLKSDAALLQDATPFGPGTFWYPGGGRVDCVYAANTSPLCYRITGAAAGAGAPAVNPVGIAAAVADRLALSLGAIRTSPAVRGVTGADSWFWLDPAPREQQLSTSLAGEDVTVNAVPSVSWQFGDGASLAGGPGVPYQPGTPPADAIVHVFQTRCLPGDQGRDPYVLSGCEADGYRLRALVSWRISYSASGPVSASGVLPTRTTEATVAYPVGEVRGFLVDGGAP